MNLQTTKKSDEMYGQKRAVFGETECPEMLAAQKKQQPVHVTRRLLVLKLKMVDGLRGKEAEKFAGMRRTSVNRIVKRYQEESTEAIAGVRHHNIVSAEQQQALDKSTSTGHFLVS
ncbi:MAG: hypothetical protein QM308_09070 [Bacillota bacterium]|nr:hypothetical protein [Bacillota bacterium]